MSGRPEMNAPTPAGGVSRRGPDSIVKNAASTFAAQMTTASLTAVMTVFLVRGLGVREYGLFALTIGMSTIAMAFADLGISDSTARFVAERRERSDDELGALVSDALKLKIVATGLLCALFAGLAPVIADLYGTPALVWPIRAIAVATFGQSTYQMLLGVTTALGRSAVNVRLVAAESVIEVVASLGLVIAGGGAAGAAFGRATGFVLGGVIAAGVVLRLSGRGSAHFWRPPRREMIRLVGGYAGPVFAIDASYTLSSSLCILLVGAYVGSAASGIFQAPMKVIVLIQYVGLSTAYGVAPRLARGPGQTPNVKAMNRALRGLIGFQCLALAPATVWAGPITHLLLGPGYGESAHVLQALAPFIFFSGLAPLVTIGVSYTGEARQRVPIALATLVLVSVSGVILIPGHGVVGAAIATDIAFGFYTLAHIWLCRRLLQLRIVMLLWSTACGLTAAAAMGLVLAAFGTTHLTLLSWVAGGVLGLTAFVAMMIFTREIRGADVARARIVIRGALDRLRPAPRRRGPPHAPLSAVTPRASARAYPTDGARPGSVTHPRRRRPKKPFAADDDSRSRPALSSPAAVPPVWVADRVEKATRKRARGAQVDLVHEITWKAVDDEIGAFELRPVEAGAGDTGAADMGSSPSVHWGRPMAPAPIPEARRAHAELVERLIAADWRRAGIGEGWFAHRFRSPVPAPADARPKATSKRARVLSSDEG